MKLEKYGLGPRTMNWFRSYSQERTIEYKSSVNPLASWWSLVTWLYYNKLTLKAGKSTFTSLGTKPRLLHFTEISLDINVVMLKIVQKFKYSNTDLDEGLTCHDYRAKTQVHIWDRWVRKEESSISFLTIRICLDLMRWHFPSSHIFFCGIRIGERSMRPWPSLLLWRQTPAPYYHSENH